VAGGPVVDTDEVAEDEVAVAEVAVDEAEADEPVLSEEDDLDTDVSVPASLGKLVVAETDGISPARASWTTGSCAQRSGWRSRLCPDGCGTISADRC
jgi:hypothetical protein